MNDCKFLKLLLSLLFKLCTAYEHVKFFTWHEINLASAWYMATTMATFTQIWSSVAFRHPKFGVGTTKIALTYTHTPKLIFRLQESVPLWLWQTKNATAREPKCYLFLKFLLLALTRVEELEWVVKCMWCDKTGLHSSQVILSKAKSEREYRFLNLWREKMRWRMGNLHLHARFIKALHSQHRAASASSWVRELLKRFQTWAAAWLNERKSKDNMYFVDYGKLYFLPQLQYKPSPQEPKSLKRPTPQIWPGPCEKN